MLVIVEILDTTPRGTWPGSPLGDMVIVVAMAGSSNTVWYSASSIISKSIEFGSLHRNTVDSYSLKICTAGWENISCVSARLWEDAVRRC